MDVTIDFKAAAEFPDLESGTKPKIERIRGQVRDFADAYFAAKRQAPGRIVLAPNDYEHALRRLQPRVRKAFQRQWRLDFKKRKAADPKAKRGPKPEVNVTGLTWGGIEIVRGAHYSKHRPVETMK